MAKKLQLRGGTTTQHGSFTGALREVTVDTTLNTLVVHDNSTAGGFPLAKASDVYAVTKGSDIASADPLVIAAGHNYFIVTGTTGFNDMTVAANTHFFLEFAGALTMTHVGGALDLPSGAAITTAAGDVGEFFSTAANVVTCVNYTKASGKPVKTDFVDADISGSAAIAQSKLSLDIVNANVNASAAVAVTKIAAMPYDIGFTAGFDGDMVKTDVAVATYGEMVVARALTVVGEVAYVDTAPTGTTLIMDIMKNGTTIYSSTKPLFAISANTNTAGVATTTTFAAGDRITFKITQIGSSTAGQGVRFTLKCKTNTNE